MSDKYYSATEIAILLGISEAALRAVIRRGDWPPAGFHQRGRHLWDGKTVREFMNRMKQPVPIGENRRAGLPGDCEAR